MKRILFGFAFALMFATLAIVASAEIAITFTIEDVYTLDTDEPAKAIVAHVADTEGSLQGLKTRFTFDNNIIIPVDAVDGTVSEDFSADAEVGSYPFDLGNVTSRKELELSPNYPKFVFDGENSSLDIEVYYASAFDTSDFVAWTMYFKFADGKSEADFTSESFKVEFIEYGNGIRVDNHFHYYGHEDKSYNDLVVTNNVVPAPTVITIPVTAGDIVYLQDGTKVNIAETNEAYVLTADVGYVAVNTGYDAQKTYYINGTSAELVHTDAVLGSELYSLRDRTPVYDAVKGKEVDKNGLRFQMLSSQSSRNVVDPHDVVEAGFLMTAKVQKVVDAYGESPELTHDKVESGLGLVKKGVAYDPANGIDIRMGSEDGIIDIRGVFYNIPITQKNVTTTIISRPYYKVGNTYVYGEASETTLYDVAVALRASENWDTMSEGQQNYVNEIVAQVDGWTEIVEEEIVIDIGGLYGNN